MSCTKMRSEGRTRCILIASVVRLPSAEHRRKETNAKAPQTARFIWLPSSVCLVLSSVGIDVAVLCNELWAQASFRNTSTERSQFKWIMYRAQTVGIDCFFVRCLLILLLRWKMLFPSRFARRPIFVSVSEKKGIFTIVARASVQSCARGLAE